MREACPGMPEEWAFIVVRGYQSFGESGDARFFDLTIAAEPWASVEHLARWRRLLEAVIPGPEHRPQAIIAYSEEQGFEERESASTLDLVQP